MAEQFPELKYDFEYSVAEIDKNISIAYLDAGEKKNLNVLLFIHGLSSYIPAWSKLIPLLTNQFRCIAIDLPGYAKSSAGAHSGSLLFYSETIYKFVRKLNLSKVKIVGHSMGGQIAIITALSFPSLIENLILLAPAGLETFTDEEKFWLKKSYTAESFALTNDEQIRLNYKINFFSMPEDTERMIQDRIGMKSWKNFYNYCQVVSNSFYSMLDYPVVSRLHLIAQPTLILFGRNDRLIPITSLHRNLTTEKIAVESASKIPNSKLVMIDECGHFLQFEKQNEISRIIIDFVDKK